MLTRTKPTLTAQPASDFRLWLEAEFANRSKKNSAYSLRSFARLLDVDSAFLSKILRGERSITRRTIEKFGLKLGLTPNDLNSFLTQKIPSSKQTKTPLYSNIYQQVDLDQFKLIADWYHYAILELIHVDDFEPNVKWISKTLDITFGEAFSAVERLKRLGLIQIGKENQWESTIQNSTVGHQFTIEAFRSLQKQILQQALQALDEVPFNEREQSSMTFCVDPARLPEAQLRIKKFRREISQFLEKGKSKEKVYQLSISLFPISHRNKKQGTVGHA